MIKELILKKGDSFIIPEKSDILSKNQYLLVETKPGEFVRVNKPDYSSSVKFMQIPKPISIIGVTDKNILDYWLLSDGRQLSENEYKELISKLPARDEDGDFQTIEDEFEYKKFFRDFAPKPIYKNAPIKNIYSDLEIIDAIESEYQSITSVSGFSEDPEKELFVYKPNRLEIMSFALKDTGITFEINNYGQMMDNHIVVSEHSWFEYTKLKGNYLKGDFPPSTKFTGTYKQCVYRLKSDIDAFKKVVDSYLEKRNSSAIDKAQVGAMISSIEEWIKKIRILRVVKSDEADRKQIISSMNADLEKLKQALTLVK